MTRTELAKSNFMPLNCNQAVVSVFASDFGFSSATALSMGAGFGGGMAQGKTCGVVTGAYMVIGLWSAKKTNDVLEQRTLAREKVKQFNTVFLKTEQSLECSNLLGYDMSLDKERAKAKEAGLFDAKCPEFIGEAVTILEDILD